MLSYRHSFHAGNAADVLKHTVLVHILQHLKNKEKPFCYVDTHAGAGLYSLNSEQAEKTQEYKQGIEPLLHASAVPDSIKAYLNVVKQFNPDDTLTHYPGSPLIAQQLLRRQDRLFLYELHSSDTKLLESSLGRDRRVQCHHADGLKHCLGLMPPAQRRGLVLIDPSYEVKTDYDQVFKTLLELYKRFSTGTYALWYPVVERARINELERKIQASSLKNVQLLELAQQNDSHEYGMTASGLIIVNPPWTLKSEMELALPYLAKQLGLAGQGNYRIKQLKDE